METNPPKSNPKSTWLEIAVAVTVLLAISMSVVPRLTKAMGCGRLEEMSDTLYLVRCTIEQYRTEHKGLFPGQRTANQLVLPAEFVRDLTQPQTEGHFRYFQRFPENPFIQCDDRRNTVTCVNDPNIQPDGTEGTAWWFNGVTGEFRACDNKFHTAY
jgi:type II secretory pathway pseudopilin PulG